MNHETIEHLRLNPDEQREVYRSPVTVVKCTPKETLEKFKAEHPDWKQLEREYQERSKVRSENF